MKCEIIQDLIPTYCEGVCSEETKILVEAHIQECAACRQEIEAYQEIETMDDARIKTVSVKCES